MHPDASNTFSHSPANVSRKRRPHRNVVDEEDFSPPQPAQEDGHLPDTSQVDIDFDENADDEEVDLPVPDDDDPQVDWRTTQAQCGLAERDDEDDLTLRPAQRPPAYKVPDAVLEAEASFHSLSSSSTDLLHVDQIYADFLNQLCRETATEYIEAYVLKGLPFAVNKAESLSLSWRLVTENLLYAFALVVHVWQVVGLQAQHGSFHTRDESLSVQWASHFLSAHTLVCSIFGDPKVSVDRFRFALQYWETRVFKIGGTEVWSKASWLRSIDGPILTPVRPRNEIAKENLRVLEDEGKLGLALHVLNREIEGPTTPLRTHLDPNKQDEKKWAVSEIFGIFNGMNIELLKALIEGNLPGKAELVFHEVWTDLERTNRPEITRPSIYMNCICDRMGISPTPAQWKTVCENMEAYTQSESSELAAAVDQLIYPSKRWPVELAYRNLRRYTEWRSWLNDDDRHPNGNHRSMVRHFVDEMRKRIANEAEHVPLAAPVIEIGYSINSHERLDQHARHRNSNYLMNLSEAMFEYCFPGSFRLQQRIIYNCYSKQQTWLGEIVLTQLGQGYTEGGGGFSHHPAGNSNGSAYRKTSPKDWDRYEAEAFSDGRMEAELDHEVAWAQQRREAQKQAYESERQRLIRLGDLVESMTEVAKRVNDVNEWKGA